MSGHSKWAGIKHKKAIIDKKKGKVWTKAVREITIAAKMGGGDPDSNPRLRTAIDFGKASNMPAENIKRAIQKGTGEIPGVVFEELTFEGYGPGKVALYCEGSTDSRNRTTNEIRHTFEKNGGSMGAPGTVSFLFEKKGYITIGKSAIGEDELMSLILELGAEDLKTDEADIYEILTAPADYDAVLKGVEDKGLEPESKSITMLPTTTVVVDKEKAVQLFKLIEILEDNDDISNVYANFDIPDNVLAELEQE